MRKSKSPAVIVAAAIAGVAGYVQPAEAASITWVGSVADPNSASYTTSVAGLNSGTLLRLWDTSAVNFNSTGSPVAYTTGDSVFFTDNVTGGQVLRLGTDLNPAAMTFIDGGGSGAQYWLLRTGDFLDGAIEVASDSPFGTSDPSTILTLDTGFDGKVFLRARANTGSLGSVNGQTIIRSGELEINDALALPGGAAGSNPANTPNVTLAGGQLTININTGGNDQPASTNLTGLLDVTANSVLAQGQTAASRRTWGQAGTINVNNGVVLRLKSLAGVPMRIDSNLSGTGTLLLEDVGAGTVTTVDARSNFSSPTLNFNLGSGSSVLLSAVANMQIGALYGGVNTRLTGGAATNQFSVGGNGVNTTFNGTITEGTVNKVGSGVLTLTGANTYTGSTGVDAGTLQLNRPAHAPVLSPTAATQFADIRGGSLVFDYTGGATVGPTVLTILDAGYDQAIKFSEGQIRSTTATATIGLGWRDNGTQVAVKRTYFGDADLNGQVDVADLGILASNWQSAGNWAAADFDYSGFIDVNDLGLLASNWQAGVGNPLGPSLQAALEAAGLPNVSVPEPAVASLAGAVLAGLCLRRRPSGRA